MSDPQLGLGSKLAYGIGHVSNDLCAAIWFSYLLVYLQSVVGMSSTAAGYVILLGQAVDAFSTPIIGFESDRSKGCGNYGRRKSWHLAGSICVALSFPFLFMNMKKPHQDIPADAALYNMTSVATSQSELFLHFAPFVILFQVGWAAVQVSHMALITDLTSCEKIRIELGTIRYAWTIIANIIVYSITGILFGFSIKDTQNVDDDNAISSRKLSENDAHVFETLSQVVVAVGVVFTILFHVFTREKRDINGITGSESSPLVKSITAPMTWKDWFREKQFYQVCGIYTCARMIVNISQLYMPMFLVHTLQMSKGYIAYMPLAVYCSGIIISLFLKCINTGLGRKATLLLGLLLVLGEVVCLYVTTYVLQTDLVRKAGMFSAAILLGLGGTIVTVAALAMAADLIGKHTESGAFVYGSISFGDKMANGIVVMVIQAFYPCSSVQCCYACESYYFNVMQYSVLTLVAVTLCCLATLGTKTIGKLKKHETVSSVLS